MIETTVYYYNREAHSEEAGELNAMASQKGMQVSRWVNNSKNRQIVTYMVHTGERNQFASRQENVLFETSVDAGRGGRVTDETAMMREVRQFLAEYNAPVEQPALIDGFYYSGDETIAGEPQFATNLDDAYSGFVEAFGDEADMTQGEFEDVWTHIDSDAIAGSEQLRENLRNDLRFVYDDSIRAFIEVELAKYDE